MGELIYTYDDPTSERDIQRACDVLANGGILAYPTEVNWAFGCDASNSKALDKIRALKPTHPKERPFALLVSEFSMASEICNLGNTAYRLLKKAWPGPFTVLMVASRSLPKQIKDKRRVVGVRIPDSVLVQDIIAKFGQPLATTSAPPLPNLDPADPASTPRFGYQVDEAFGHGLDLILDLGKEVPGGESTIIDFTEGHPELVREGLGDPKVFDL